MNFEETKDYIKAKAIYHKAEMALAVKGFKIQESIIQNYLYLAFQRLLIRIDGEEYGSVICTEIDKESIAMVERWKNEKESA